MAGMRVGAVLGFLLAGGCAMRWDASHAPPPVEDVTAWAHSAEAERGVILLGSDITPAAAVQVARKIVTLDADPNVTRIALLINSNGGDTSALRTIRNALHLTDKPVDTVNLGNCYSAACGIFAAATGRRYAFANAHFMVHRPQALGGTPGEVRDMLAFEVEVFERVLREARLPAGWFPLSGRARYFSAAEARDFGFVQALVTSWPPDQSKSRN